MKRYLLDTSALLTLRDEEEGADNVSELLRQSLQRRVNCFACFIKLMEVFYRVWRDEGEAEGRLAYEQWQALPLIWIHENKTLLEKAVAGISLYRCFRYLSDGLASFSLVLHSMK